jgi:hypothetical protein
VLLHVDLECACQFAADRGEACAGQRQAQTDLERCVGERRSCQEPPGGAGGNALSRVLRFMMILPQTNSSRCFRSNGSAGDNLLLILQYWDGNGPVKPNRTARQNA